jgi:hypothetical protein
VEVGGIARHNATYNFGEKIMATPVIVTGDDAVVMATLKKDGATFLVPGTATVKARVISTSHEETYTEEVTQSPSETGADWPNSLIAVRFAPANTAAVTHQGKAKIELQVDDGIKTTWFFDCVIKRGNIA